MEIFQMGSDFPPPLILGSYGTGAPLSKGEPWVEITQKNIQSTFLTPGPPVK